MPLGLPLALLFKRSFEESRLPQEWLEANVTPLFKKGNSADPGNYRPVSLTSVVGKVMERIIKQDLMDHLNKHKLITNNQHGFVKGRACVTNLLETMDFTTESMASNEWVDLLFLDFAKAFDKVPHNRLILKLKGYGISGKLLDWIRAFLSNRKQRVVLGEHKSKWTEVKSGVPQGSVLGPILFIIYINDLSDLISNVCKIYADDTKVLARIRRAFIAEDVLRLQSDIDAIREWTSKWLMKLNISKCKIMHIGKKNPRATYTMKCYDTEDHVIERFEAISTSQ